MTAQIPPIAIYLELGQKRVFAGAVDWPGWCRGGRDADAATLALVATAPRYAAVLGAAGLPFQAPAEAAALLVVERLAGNQTTDFGAPNVELPGDAGPVDGAELGRLTALLRAYWAAFDAAVAAARGRELRTGPRGGGRDLDGIVGHVMGAEQSYLARLAWKSPRQGGQELLAEQAQTRQAIVDALGAAARGELPARGPRGGAIWAPRTFVRRVAWHALDHLWEIEDRAL